MRKSGRREMKKDSRHKLVVEAVLVRKVRNELLNQRKCRAKRQVREEKEKTRRGDGRTRNEGERKFSMNQNLTVLLVCRMTEIAMIKANRCREDAISSRFGGRSEGERALTSYSKPEATVKMLISAFFLTSTTSCLALK